MESVFSFEYPIRPCDLDCRYQLQPAGVLDMFQDVAGRHAVELGIGYPQFVPKNLMWIVSGIRYQVIATPAMYETVRIVTWPLRAGTVTCRREYRMESLSGEVLVVGTSDWAVVDAVSRKLVRAKDIYPKDLVFSETLAMEGKQPRLSDFAPEGEGLVVVPAFAELDMNGHVNNTKYANFILNAADLKANEQIQDFHIHYRKEVLKGEAVTVYVKRQEKELLAMGKNEKGETMFSGRILLQ
jgi:acyl-ACP thioesterase